MNVRHALPAAETEIQPIAIVYSDNVFTAENLSND